jgi:hypothetical protein
MTQTLVKNKKYAGHYVALKSFEDNSVVGYGKTPKTALNRARKEGHQDPVILYVPRKDTVLIY